MTATTPPRAPVVGRYVSLAPMSDADLPELFAALGHPEVFAGGWGGGPQGYTPDLDAFRGFAAGYFNGGTNLTFTVRLRGGKHDGLVVGTSTLGDFDETSEHTHIGWTAYDPRVWGTVVNAETKLLMLGLAFDNGFGRAKIQADERNERSRAAILRLGATFEGLIRRDRPRADGSWRTTAMYSVIIDEWPEVRAGLEARVAAAPGPVELRAR